MNFYESWQFLVEHEIYNIESRTKIIDFDKSILALLSQKTINTGIIESRTSYFERGLSINIVKINPLTNAIDLTNDALNTQIDVWLESSIPIDGEMSHDYDLDVGGETFEVAIINLALSVLKKHG